MEVFRFYEILNLSEKRHFRSKLRELHILSQIIHNCTRREEYSNVLQTHIVIVGQMRNMTFFPKL